MQSLLVNLKKYRPRENTTPTENFVTEAFAFLLNTVPDAAQSFLSLLSSQRASLNISGPLDGDSEWSTQQNFGGVYPDMFFSLGHTQLIFEHKTDTGLSHNQLDNYRSYAAKHYNQFLLVLITRHEKQHQQSPDIKLCWRDVYVCLQPLLGRLEEHSKAHWIVSEFLSLLKNEGLGPIAPMSFDGMWHFMAAKQFEGQFNQFVNRLAEEPWPQMAAFDLKIGRQWGRNGLEFRYVVDNKPTWRPGLFIGMLHAPEDHCVTHRNIRGVNLVVIVSFSKAIHPYYASLDAYKSLPRYLTEASQNHPIWHFYNHHQDGEYAKQNRYHAYYLEAPLVDVLIGTETATEQYERLYQVLSEGLDIVVKSAGFEALVKELALLRTPEQSEL
ncbi:hypothetical protein ACFOEE_18355 [Pseudoalteromonas fenneropenaei]|uniref:PD-(D/E)XK nuclease family protein n=1 Tax=Pseudoalteromonas fenneropenaei TaxID=1737459 RepID=A0ABV7CPL9_9GAMM